MKLEKVISHWNTPTVWKHSGREYLLCSTGGNPGEARLNLIDPAAGTVLWTLAGLHATSFNLAPSNDHVLVNVGSAIFSEKANGSAPRNAKGQAPLVALARAGSPPQAQRLPGPCRTSHIS